MHSEMIKRAFNKAHAYDDHCHLQLATGDMLIQRLKKIKSHAKNILDVGCGTGLLSQALCSAISYETYHGIDIADNLLSHAKIKLIKQNQFLHHLNFNDVSVLNQKFDIIYANLSLHWSEDIAHTLMQLCSQLTDNGILALSIPLRPSLEEISSYFKVRAFLEWNACLKLLSALPYKLLFSENNLLTFQYPTLKEALYSIKNVGANYTSSSMRPIHRLKQLLKQTTKPQTLTYQIGYFIIGAT